MMKSLFLVLLVTFCYGQRRTIEIHSKDGDIVPLTLKVNQHFIDKHLFGSTKLKFIDTTNQKIYPQLKAYTYPSNPTQQKIVNEINKNLQKSQVITYLEKLTSFPHRRSNRRGSEASSEWLKETAEEIISKLPEERRKLFSIEMVDVPRYFADSVIITMKGRVDESVIIGAHCDDVGHPNAGADDNGSGTVSVMEAFRIIANSDFVPNRTVKFMYYSAEESGLVGSNVIATKYRNERKEVYASLNTDMVGYVANNAELRGYVVKSSTSGPLSAFLEKLIAEYSGIPYESYNRSYGSDHISWHRAGYPSACWKEFNFSPHWHRATDKTENINYDLIVEFVKVHVGFIVELSLAN